MMKPLVPSTPGEVAIVVRLKQGVVTSPTHFAKFASVREETNALIKEHDTPDNPVVRVEIRYAFPVERR